MDPNPLLSLPVAPRHGSASHSRTSSSSTVQELSSDYAAERAFQPPPSTTLHRSAYPLVLASIYISLALFSWVATCVLTFKYQQIKKGLNPNDDYYYSSYYSNRIDKRFGTIEQLYEAAKIIQSILAVSTIPITTAICSSAAVIFMQRKRKTGNFSIRQIVTLADRRWGNLAAYAELFLDWKRYGSTLLLMAIMLTLLGGTIPPLQQFFLTSTPFKLPRESRTIERLLDIPDQWRGMYQGEDRNLVPLLTRKALTTASLLEPQAQLWEGLRVNCSDWHNRDSDYSESCTTNGKTLSNMGHLRDPFFAELSNNLHTGVFSQYAPRINSTARYESAQSFPSGCAQLPGAYFVEYANTGNDTYNSSWGIQACMPADNRNSPWKPTRDRQDFSEEMFLNITLHNMFGAYDNGPASSVYKVTIYTTAGYFELPNYMNGGIPGPLLLADFNNSCDERCTNQLQKLDWESSRSQPRPSTIAKQPNNTDALELVSNKGPLLTMAMALFGPGSFIATRMANPLAYRGVGSVDNANGHPELPVNYASCVDLPPMASLLLYGWGNGEGYRGGDCIQNTAGGTDGSLVSNYLAAWISTFNLTSASEKHVNDISNAFTAAAFLANKAWVMSNIASPFDRHLTVSYDLGKDALVPSISMQGVIIVSVLLGTYLLGLLAMAIYAAYSPRWTDALDAFTMMRVGAAMSTKTPIPLMVGRNTDKIAVLDETSGWVGESWEESYEGVVQLELGASKLINGANSYTCYEGNSEMHPRVRAQAQERLRMDHRQRLAAVALRGKGEGSV